MCARFSRHRHTHLPLAGLPLSFRFCFKSIVAAVDFDFLPELSRHLFFSPLILFARLKEQFGHFLFLSRTSSFVCILCCSCEGSLLLVLCPCSAVIVAYVCWRCCCCFYDYSQTFANRPSTLSWQLLTTTFNCNCPSSPFVRSSVCVIVCPLPFLIDFITTIFFPTLLVGCCSTTLSRIFACFLPDCFGPFLVRLALPCARMLHLGISLLFMCIYYFILHARIVIEAFSSLIVLFLWLPRSSITSASRVCRFAWSLPPLHRFAGDWLVLAAIFIVAPFTRRFMCIC